MTDRFNLDKRDGDDDEDDLLLLDAELKARHPSSVFPLMASVAIRSSRKDTL
jgi:hypothetical protein